MHKKILALVLVLTAGVVVLGGCAEVARPTEDSDGTAGVQVNLGSTPKGIQVTGTGKVSVVPDVSVLSLGVSAQAATVAEAQTQAATAMQGVMSSLRGGGVADKDIQTQNFSIQQVTRWDDKQLKEVVIGYLVVNTVTAKIRQVEKTGDIIDSVASAGGDLTRINGISFTVDNPASFYTEARNQAMADAKARASQLASLGGVKLGKPVLISESGAYNPPPIPIRVDIGKVIGAPETPISTGQMEITLSVQVNYDIAE